MRIIKNFDSNITVAYGVDHAVGYFIQVFDKTAITDTNEEGITLDEDYLFDKLTIEKFTYFLKKYDCDLSILNYINSNGK